jgi:ssDNA-binding Zn-finger/Zn-ribbon topoisomerase 1
VLDAIEEGRETRLAALLAFWRRFERALAAAGARPDAQAGAAAAEDAAARAKGPRRAPPAIDPALGPCPTCGAGLARRPGRYGPFVGCSRYPACRYVRKNAAGTGVRCPACHEGEVVAREAAKTREAAAKGRRFYGCSRYPKCRFTETHRPLAESCPACGRSYLLEREAKAEGRVVYCGSGDCTYHRTE